MVKSRKHFLLVPFPAFGHIIPLLELGKKIVKHHDVTFAVSACLVDKIRKRELVSESDFPLIGVEDGYVDVEMDVDQPDVPEEFEKFMRGLFTGVATLFSQVPAADKSEPSHGITSPIDVVIADNIFASALAACHARGIPCHHFNTMSISMTLGALMLEDDSPTLPDTMEHNFGFLETLGPNSKTPVMPAMMKTMMLPINKNMHMVSGIVVNSVRDIDEELLKMIETYPIMKNIPIRFVGPLVPVLEKTSPRNLEQQNQVARWLDGKDARSVVYVSFGSLVFPMPAQLTELVNALIQLEKPFIFSLAAGQHKHLSPEITVKMATQFEHGQFLVLPWAPQKLILQHPATAVFLSHCGWNSTMESVFSGMPVVAWPMFADQKPNAEWLAKNGLAVMIEGTGFSKLTRFVPADEIASTIRSVGWVSDSDSVDTIYRQAAWRWRKTVVGVNGMGGTAEQALQDLMASV